MFRSWAGSASMWIKVRATIRAPSLCVLYLRVADVSGGACEQGGEAVWGNATHAPDDESDKAHTHGELIAFRRELSPAPPDMDTSPMSGNASAGTRPVEVGSVADGNGSEQGTVSARNMTAEEAGTWILEHTPTSFQVSALSRFSAMDSVYVFALMRVRWWVENDAGELFVWDREGRGGSRAKRS